MADARIIFYFPDYYPLNNFSAHAISFYGIDYPTSEHAYQAQKCLSAEGKDAIRRARSPLEAKDLANKTYKTSRDPDWEQKKVQVMKSILEAKLAQHREVRDLLEASGSSLVVEDSPVDYFWGEGADGSGKNVLGELWMEIRGDTE